MVHGHNAYLRNFGDFSVAKLDKVATALKYWTRLKPARLEL